jgi:hypothetical protein
MKIRGQNPGAAVRLLVAAGLVVSLGACGGDSDTMTQTCPAGQVGSPPNCMDPPDPCNQSTLVQESGGIPGSTIVVDDFSVPEDSRLDITLDWTNPASLIGFYLVPASTCTLEEFNQRSCDFLIRLEPPNSKPAQRSIQVNAGNYRWMIGNYEEEQESVSIQIVQSTGDCAAVTGTPPSASERPGASALPVQGLMQR